MIDFEAARIKMVEHQIRTTDVTSHSVLRAFLSVPREAFVSEKAKPLAYLDADIELSPGRYLMEASPLAKLLQAAEITKNDRALDVGAGSGYVAALLSHLAGSVTALESDGALCELAAANLNALGCQNVTVVTGELTKGYAAAAPYDLIFVNGSVEEVPAALLEQLAEGGRLVAVIGYGNAAQAKILLKEHGSISESSRFNLSVKPLPGFAKVKEFVF
ncbi:MULTISPECIES: protein-L-isoaspartate O-methyltransferase family protein [Rhizobiaceae]|jgi:protein-L-isoaspartate(D-aspartate) O-methyltransferase|uniref:Protein-L-isoaspartate O-methyltransferase n=1 Tax=Aliirhizobium cellulosilyticum TaxID=393664 RepID=A0A7W6WPA9_9HYPH|nr:protein-L-isoaspartate O-methyltransferase [Rhizobium cellulosilyticum]MBB4347911.1 protein-L-isoaspartate(D-aspartate) O-methyltransferase [Rhizobium cellulosilyticum]MBB4409695.1 protein-L-isoaspartate(D-aspartate) O-methyltransferase [Rhizobium cellulosilyticum]MBB4444382.1 protein-L-isoaspartate(D-aspartate) O-methyltransferase [Rhizobium cellulosilyticum]